MHILYILYIYIYTYSLPLHSWNYTSYEPLYIGLFVSVSISNLSVNQDLETDVGYSLRTTKCRLVLGLHLV